MNLATNTLLLKPFAQTELPNIEALSSYAHVPAHLTPQHWQAANRHLVKKFSVNLPMRSSSAHRFTPKAQR